MLERIRELKAAGDAAGVSRLIPYAGLVGLDCRLDEDGLLTVLEPLDTNIGNTLLPAIHGGVIGALLEHAATVLLLWETETARMPKIINLSVDYLRPAGPQRTFARGTVIKQGRKIANVRVEAWQADRARPVAAGHAHFLLAG